MRRALILLCVICRVSLEIQAVQRFLVSSRKTRANARPTKTEYTYTHIKDEPAIAVTSGNEYVEEIKYNNEEKKSAKNKLLEKPTGPTDKMEKNMTSSKQSRTFNSIIVPKDVESDMPDKRNSSQDNKFAASNMIPSYDNEFHVDEDDVRGDTRNSYYVWPFFYYGPYEYESIRIDVENEKAKDKRFVIPDLEKVIPVHENVNENIHDSRMDLIHDLKHTEVITTDNPNFGNQPFFSYVLNDYFDKTDDDDSLPFKGLSWGKEFDHEMSFQDIDDYAKRIRRLEEKYPTYKNEKDIDTVLENDSTNEALNSKTYDLHHDSENSQKGDENKHNFDGRYKYNGGNYREFKDFADSFANRFGSEDHNRVSSYAKKNNANKGDKKKGFRKVYHKDEYQEHQDFFDNTDNSENFEEKGSSKVNIGGSEAFLRSQAAAVLGNDGNTINQSESYENEDFDANHQENQRYNGINAGLNQYKNVAKNAALSNNADYIDRYAM